MLVKGNDRRLVKRTFKKPRRLDFHDLPHVRLGGHYELIVENGLDRSGVIEEARRRVNVDRLVGFQRSVRVSTLLQLCLRKLGHQIHAQSWVARRDLRYCRSSQQ